ncbi:hypothetical protein IQ260_29065 [Leptolyngbya cf. ectocarpi LEGE 11479]|uniref:Uncharacterized protein n=1 Tax=Leptolyngbya cf. ectocarpi LEGE 11479 TaxID=1828722 RepID=A0A929A0B6_LEPEC|nr:hypothetical protein [Leptolyngbya ectocarpi]MBE9070696.1 hypothetical protein [Leptolyngbya cf. ectocarpi LEGE 11479]
MVSPEQERMLANVLKSDIETLYASIGYFEEQKKIGVAPSDRKKLTDLGKQWVNDRKDKIRDLICTNNKINALYNSNSEDDKDKIEAILLIADLIVAICSGIPAIYVSTLIIKIGLKELCNEQQNMD